MNDENISRKNSLRLPNFDYASRCHFVTIVTHERRKFFNNKRIAESTIETLVKLREKYNFNLYSYCLMPDHFHGLNGIGDSEMTLGRIIGDLKSLATKEFWKFYDGKMWQRQFYDQIIRYQQDFEETIKYIRLNPVEAKFVDNWRDWKWTVEKQIYNFNS